MGGEWWVSISSQLPFPNRCLQTEQQQCHVMLEWRSTDSSVPQYRCSTLPPCHSDACDSDQEVFPSKGCIRAWCMQTRRLVTTMTTMETELNPLFSGFLVAHYFRGSTLILDMQIWWLWRKKNQDWSIERKFHLPPSAALTSLRWSTGGLEGDSFLQSCSTGADWRRWLIFKLPLGELSQLPAPILHQVHPTAHCRSVRARSSTLGCSTEIWKLLAIICG